MEMRSCLIRNRSRLINRVRREVMSFDLLTRANNPARSITFRSSRTLPGAVELECRNGAGTKKSCRTLVLFRELRDQVLR